MGDGMDKVKIQNTIHESEKSLNLTKNNFLTICLQVFVIIIIVITINYNYQGVQYHVNCLVATLQRGIQKFLAYMT